MSYLGIDTSKDFTVNGMKYSKNKDGWYESEANSEAPVSYTHLVFLTGYTQYVMDVFEVITFDYISKPITVEKLESVLLKAMQLSLIHISQITITGFYHGSIFSVEITGLVGFPCETGILGKSIR